MESERNACFQEGCLVCQPASETGFLPSSCFGYDARFANKWCSLFHFANIRWYQEAMEPLRHNNIYLVTHKTLAVYKQKKREINLNSRLFQKMEEGQIFHIPGNQFFLFPWYFPVPLTS